MAAKKVAFATGGLIFLPNTLPVKLNALFRTMDRPGTTCWRSGDMNIELFVIADLLIMSL